MINPPPGKRALRPFRPAAAILPPPKAPAKLRRCLKCETDFESDGPHNRLCPKCGLRARHSSDGLEPAGGGPGNHGRKGAA